MYFDDGVNKGNLRVKATSEDHAARVAKEKLKQIWGKLNPLDIEIIRIVKG